LIRTFLLYNDQDVEKFNAIYYKSGNQSSSDLGKITSLFTPILKAHAQITEEEQYKFKKTVKNYVKWYSYITQITRMFDKELQLEYNFLLYMDKVLPNKPSERVNLEDKIKLEYYRLDKTFEGQIPLENPFEYGVIVNPKTVDADKSKERKDELLETIIEHINNRFDGIFTPGDKVIVETIYGKVLNNNSKLVKYAKKNNAEVFQDNIFPDVFKAVAHECYSEQMDAFRKLFEDKAFYNTIMQEIAKETYRSFRNA